MKISSASLNRKKRSIEVKTRSTHFSLPWSRLPIKPTAKSPLLKVEVDEETGRESLLLYYGNGTVEAVPFDAFLDYNRDPDYLRELVLHEMSIHALDVMKTCGLSKHEIMRRLQTSPSQLYRLLDPANYQKSVDQMLRLLAVLGSHVQWKFGRPKLAA